MHSATINERQDRTGGVLTCVKAGRLGSVVCSEACLLAAVDGTITTV
jgi:hypothetical protein